MNIICIVFKSCQGYTSREYLCVDVEWPTGFFLIDLNLKLVETRKDLIYFYNIIDHNFIICQFIPDSLLHLMNITLKYRLSGEVDRIN